MPADGTHSPAAPQVGYPRRHAPDGPGVSSERVYTRPTIEKLGVRPGMRVALVGVSDGPFLSALATLTDDVTEGLPLPDSDLVFLAADSLQELAPLADLRHSIKSAGAIWVVSRKGKAATLRDVDVMAMGRAAGLIDNKVVAFSDTHTSLRLVIPRDQR
jgi:hypothetical protein